MINNIIYSSKISESIEELLQTKEYDKLFILTDENTLKFAMPLLSDSKKCSEAHVITILADDTNKNLENLSTIWRALVSEGATRKSLLINLGGGMVTDMGGFAAATFKRGIEHINIPTTLLGAVDAAVGGKTGINFEGLKNEIGAFKQPSAVVIDTRFFKTLSKEHLLSGFAEMLKHGLISNMENYNKLISFDISKPDYDELLNLVADSVSIKENIVEEDPLEKGIRKYLNLGHTSGHAIESLAMKRNTPVQHGYAVAWGLVCEAILSYMKFGFSQSEIHRLVDYVKANYGAFKITCDDYAYLYEKITHDKKNESGRINYTLLKAVGEVEINVSVTKEEIESSFDLYRDLFGL
ncbi:MAG: 3-dehydroquinate synthase [Muribaculaceae bacterium]|nr:3-dehydroquinate synthase [Muribaculaceae bacterium]